MLEQVSTAPISTASYGTTALEGLYHHLSIPFQAHCLRFHAGVMSTPRHSPGWEDLVYAHCSLLTIMSTIATKQI
jgi:hypothetical protein